MKLNTIFKRLAATLTAAVITIAPVTASASDIYESSRSHGYSDDTITASGTYYTSARSFDEPIAIELDISGEYKTVYYVGDDFDLTGLELTAKWSSGEQTEVDPGDVIVSGYDKNERGIQKVTLTYGAVSKDITVTVLARPTADKSTIKITLRVYGDDEHEVTETNKHTLKNGGLQTWINETYEVDLNATVWDVFQKAFEEEGITCENSTGSYIESVTRNGVTLGSFTNGAQCGWIYTLNGEYAMNGISDQYLNDGDRIVLFFTDDYTVEDGSEFRPGGEDDTDPGDKYTSDEMDSIYKNVGDKLSAMGTPVVGALGGEWAVIGLIRSGREPSEDYYMNVVDYVREHIDENGRLHRAKSSDQSRVILALTALGYDVTNVGGYDLLKGLSDLDFVKKQGINGSIWALIAFDSHGYDIPDSADGAEQTTREKLIGAILAAQLPDGGWSLTESGSADSDVTAMVLIALAPYSEAKPAINKALACLSDIQLGNGGFGGIDGICAESCAQVILALAALGIDSTTDARFIKNDRSVVDALLNYAAEGGFKHLSDGNVDEMATEQGYCALAAYYRFKDGKTALFDMSDVTIRGADPDVPGDEENPPTGVSFGLSVCFILTSAATVFAVKSKRTNKK